ncbi:MAG: acyl-CoA reductase [Acidobacteriota bacterium]
MGVGGFLTPAPDPSPAAAAARIAQGAAELRNLSTERLFNAWCGAVEAFLDPSSEERAAIERDWVRSTRLSATGLNAGLRAVLGGLRGQPARRLFASSTFEEPSTPDSPVLVVLASNLPALAAQPLLPCLALRRPTLLKSPSAEPFFAPALVRALAHREPVLGKAVAAAAWKGGDRAVEAPVLDRVGRVLAYGDAESIADLERRAPGKVHAYGPKTSVAILSSGSDPVSSQTIAGLARDIALFDQRGCLSVTAVFTTGDPRWLADRLAAALGEAHRRLPPGPPTLAEQAAVRQLRGAAAMAGLYRPQLPAAAGTVVVAAEPIFEPSPGLRTVRVLPIDRAHDAVDALRGWSGRIQGVALAGMTWKGETGVDLRCALAALGISRFAAPGELQSPDASWHNGGDDPLRVLCAT